MTSVQITNPSLPFWDAIPGGLSVGKVIQIQGVFFTVFDKSEYGEINLCENLPDTKPLHISIRFNCRRVIRNTSFRKSWQSEEKDGSFPFGEGRQFIIQIVVQTHGYEISVNGQYCWTYNHRLPYVGVTHLNIDGPLVVWNVEYRGSSQAQGRSLKPLPSAGRRIVSNPPLPYLGYLPQRLAVGDRVEIKGIFPGSIDRSQFTAINLCQNTDATIAFHMSIRFNHKEVVRNTYRKGEWDSEEKGGPFPFALGKEFSVEIVVNLFAYQISVNGQYCWSFAHRLPFGMVNGVSIDGPVNIWNVDFMSSAEQQQVPQKQPTYSRVSPTPHAPPAPQEPSYPLESVYNPAVPFSYNISGGIRVGMMVYISGIPFANYQRFTVSFQCGQQNCPDIAFQFDVRGYSGIVARNTRRNNRWEDEETAASCFPFYQSIPFDMMVLVQNDKYMVAVNGAHFIEYYHRIPRFKRINTLKIDNDVRITSVRFA